LGLQLHIKTSIKNIYNIKEGLGLQIQFIVNEVVVAVKLVNVFWFFSTVKRKIVKQSILNRKHLGKKNPVMLT